MDVIFTVNRFNGKEIVESLSWRFGNFPPEELPLFGDHVAFDVFTIDPEYLSVVRKRTYVSDFRRIVPGYWDIELKTTHPKLMSHLRDRGWTQCP